MRFFLFLAASVCIALAWLLPIHYRPWVTYTGELFAFLSLFAEKEQLAKTVLNEGHQTQ
jgi:hypothetical protein